MRCAGFASACAGSTRNSRSHEEGKMRTRLRKLIMLAPVLFGWPSITFWQALGLLALCRILFGGLGLHGSGRSGFRRRMHERWERMTPEERERFRQGFRGRFGLDPS